MSAPNSTGRDVVEAAILAAERFHGRGTSFIHTKTTKDTIGNSDDTTTTSRSIVISNPTGAVVEPISLATTFVQRSPGVPMGLSDPNSFGLGYEYSRTGNPTRGAFERAMAQAEGAKHCAAYASGSAATAAVLHLLQPTDNVIVIDDVYGGTQRYFRRIASPCMNITFDFVDFSDLRLLESKLMEGKTKLLWLETPTNPTLKVSDIAASASLSHNYGAMLVVDNTFCSPYTQNPLAMGADAVVHSVTKYISGHSDCVMGVVCTDSDDVFAKLRFIQNGIGAVPSPFDCFLAHRGLKTLHVRLEAAAANAKAIAMFLEKHEGVTRVLYPGLSSHPQHELAMEQQNGSGGAIVTFYCVGGKAQSAAILENLKVFALAESLGAVESLAECPSLMTHASVPDEQRAILGIDDTLIRLSVGIESCRDLVDDLDNALNAALKTLENGKGLTTTTHWKNLPLPTQLPVIDMGSLKLEST